MIIRTRILASVTAPPVEDGAVFVSDGRVVWAGAWKGLSGHTEDLVVDLGDTILLSGLVNAHCHLEYTAMAGALPPPRTFPDWIKSILTAKSDWCFSDYSISWLNGASQLLKSGTTTVADIVSVPELLDVTRGSTPLRVHSFLEMTGVRSRRNPREIVGEAIEHLKDLPTTNGQVGLSPHALYSTTPALLTETVQAARENNYRVSMHVSESQAEFEMFMYARGPMYDWLAPQRDRKDCGVGSPIRLCERSGLLNAGFIAAHVNYLWQDDAQRLAAHRANVVHCPQSHAYFRHHRFPRVELQQAGVNVALGTDSLASTRMVGSVKPTLSLFDEMRALAQTDSLLTPRNILAMATVHGARALGLSSCAGGLFPGSFADFTAIPYRGSLEAAEEYAISFSGSVNSTWIAGHRVWQNPNC